MSFLGYYEKRLKIQLLRSEVRRIHGTAQTLFLEGQKTSVAVNLNTFSLAVVESILADAYVILAEYPHLLAALEGIRNHAGLVNNKQLAFFPAQNTWSSTEEIQLAMNRKHNCDIGVWASEIVKHCQTAELLWISCLPSNKRFRMAAQGRQAQQILVRKRAESHRTDWHRDAQHSALSNRPPVDAAPPIVRRQSSRAALRRRFGNRSQFRLHVPLNPLVFTSQRPADTAYRCTCQAVRRRPPYLHHQHSTSTAFASSGTSLTSCRSAAVIHQPSTSPPPTPTVGCGVGGGDGDGWWGVGATAAPLVETGGHRQRPHPHLQTAVP